MYPVRVCGLRYVYSSPLILSTNKPSEQSAFQTYSMAAEHSALSSSFPVEMPAPGSSFMDALLSQAVPSLDKHDNKMLTENGDLAFRSSGNALVDLFFELEDVVSGARLKEVLANSWAENPDATLRIIWNARSIHLGKGSRNTFYRALGWLAETRPKTLLANLPWLVRPIIKKKAPKKDKSSEKTELATADAKDDAVMVDAELSDDDFDIIDADEGEAGEKVPSKQPQSVKDDNELSEFDVKYGCAHGYWKDLLNILSLAANDELKADGDPRKVFNIDNRTSKKRTRDWTKGHKKTVLAERHEHVDKKLREDEFYKSLHFTVAQLFVDQLKLDKLRLASPRRTRSTSRSLPSGRRLPKALTTVRHSSCRPSLRCSTLSTPPALKASTQPTARPTSSTLASHTSPRLSRLFANSYGSSSATSRPRSSRTSCTSA